MTKYRMRTVFWNVLNGTLLWTLALMLSTPVTGSLYAGSKRAMTTVQYDNAHTGWNQDEDILSIENVNPDKFGKIWTADLDGQIYGAPLYVSGVNIGGKEHNVVYVATEHNLIHALNAETGEQLWDLPYFLGPWGLRRNLGCGSIEPDVGITGTPVIDLEAKTLYAVGLTCEDDPCQTGSTQIFKMAAVDIETGKSIDGWPVIIDPPDADFPIDTRVTSDRGALLLVNGMVYVPFGGYRGDCGPYHGWVVGVDTTKPTAQIFYRTPSADQFGRNIRGSGMWASGGIAADKDGFIYAATGNSFGASDRDIDYSNAVLRLAPDLSFSEKPADFFMPSNWAFLNSRDIDLGSSAPMLLPPQKGSNTPNMIFITGKWGVGHLIDRDNLGGVAKGDGTNGEGVYSTEVFGSAFSTAAYYEDPDPSVGSIIFLAGRGTQPDFGTSSGVVALGLAVDDAGNSSYKALWATPSMSTAMSPVVTSTPGQTGILWVVDRGGTLFAFNAATGKPLYRDSLGSGTRNFLHFTVIDGKAFVGNAANQVVAYGLLK